MAEINIGEITEALNNKSDIDLNNLNSTGAEKLDGEWVQVNLNLLSQTNLHSIEDLTIDLSEYLPQDNNLYECTFSMTLQTGTTNGNYCSIQITNEFGNKYLLCGAVNRSANYELSYSTATLLIGTSRIINIRRDDNNSWVGQINELNFLTYRKVR